MCTKPGTHSASQCMHGWAQAVKPTGAPISDFFEFWAALMSGIAFFDPSVLMSTGVPAGGFLVPFHCWCLVEEWDGAEPFPVAAARCPAWLLGWVNGFCHLCVLERLQHLFRVIIKQC